MDELQKQKAIKALEEHRAKEHKKMLAMMFHLGAFTKLHCMGVLLPYKVLYGIEKQKHEGTFTEVEPNAFYPHPGVSMKVKNSEPHYNGDYQSVIGADGQPDFTLDAEYQREWQEYQQRIDAEKTPADKLGYWYGRFLIEYDIPAFTDFDIWGKMPENTEEKNAVDGMRKAFIEIWEDCKVHPEEYNQEPIPRLEEHKSLYDVGYGYI